MLWILKYKNKNLMKNKILVTGGDEDLQKFARNTIKKNLFSLIKNVIFK